MGGSKLQFYPHSRQIIFTEIIIVLIIIYVYKLYNLLKHNNCEVNEIIFKVLFYYVSQNTIFFVLQTIRTDICLEYNYK